MKRVMFVGAIALVSLAPARVPRAQGREGVSGGAAVQEVPSGTRFLVSLEETLSTANLKAGDHFRVRTIEPLVTETGMTLPAGAELRGHVDKVEGGHKAGRARMWLTFDDVQTAYGRAPIVADVADIPGVHSVKVDYEREGEIEARNSTNQQAAMAAAAGAFVGAAPGVTSGNGKAAATGAAVGAATAFMIASGLGQEVTLEKGTKIELILDRPLYLSRS